MKILTELSPEEKRILAADACGWTEITDCTCGLQAHGYEPDSGAHKKHLPDYGNDLNASAEMEATLTAVERVIFRTRLATLCGDSFSESVHATAAQRLDAFLLAKGLAE